MKSKNVHEIKVTSKTTPVIKPPAQRAFMRGLLQLMRPLVRIALRLGIPYRGFDRLVRRAYVDVAGELEFSASQSSPQTISGISAVSGIRGRHRVKEIMDMTETELFGGMDKIGDQLRSILRLWSEQRTYQNPENPGSPAVIPVYGPAPSLQDLVAQVFPRDVSVNVILGVAIRREFIVEAEPGYLLHNSNNPRRKSRDPSHIKAGMDGVHLISSTVEHNFSCDPNERLYQRHFTSGIIPTAKKERAMRLIRDHLDESNKTLSVKLGEDFEDEFAENPIVLGWGSQLYDISGNDPEISSSS